MDVFEAINSRFACRHPSTSMLIRTSSAGWSRAPLEFRLGARLAGAMGVGFAFGFAQDFAAAGEARPISRTAPQAFSCQAKRCALIFNNQKRSQSTCPIGPKPPAGQPRIITGGWIAAPRTPGSMIAVELRVRAKPLGRSAGRGGAPPSSRRSTVAGRKDGTKALCKGLKSLNSGAGTGELRNTLGGQRRSAKSRRKPLKIRGQNFGRRRSPPLETGDPRKPRHSPRGRRGQCVLRTYCFDASRNGWKSQALVSPGRSAPRRRAAGGAGSPAPRRRARRAASGARPRRGSRRRAPHGRRRARDCRARPGRASDRRADRDRRASG